VLEIDFLVNGNRLELGPGTGVFGVGLLCSSAVRGSHDPENDRYAKHPVRLHAHCVNHHLKHIFSNLTNAERFALPGPSVTPGKNTFKPR
jgi:hypothetical protein